MPRKRLTQLFALLLMAAMTTTVFAFPPPDGKGGGKGGGDEEPPNLSPVVLQPHIFQAPGGWSIRDVYDTNNNLQTVGSYSGDMDGDGYEDFTRGYLYDPQVNASSAIDLNDIVSGITDGWAIRKARAINTQGDIAAYIEPIATPLESLQAVFIDMDASGTSGVLHVIPDSEITSYSVAYDMNDVGDIVAKYERDDGTLGVYLYNFGLYDPLLETPAPIDVGASDMMAGRIAVINNNGQVVYQEADGTVVRTTLGGSFETFSNIDAPGSVNDFGEFCGAASVQIRKNRSESRPCVVGTQVEDYDIDGETYATDLNESADFVAGEFIYHQVLGAVNAISLLDPSDPDSTFLETSFALSLRTIIDRDLLTDFPTVAGTTVSIDLNQSQGFVLVPTLAP